MQKWQKSAIKRLLRPSAADLDSKLLVEQIQRICTYKLDKSHCNEIWEFLESRFANEIEDWQFYFNNITLKNDLASGPSYILIKSGLLYFRNHTWSLYYEGSQLVPKSCGAISHPLQTKKEKRWIIRQLVFTEQFHCLGYANTHANKKFAKNLWNEIKYIALNP